MFCQNGKKHFGEESTINYRVFKKFGKSVKITFSKKKVSVKSE